MRRTVCKTVPCYILSLIQGFAPILFKGWMSVFVNRNDTDEHRVDNQRNQRNLREIIFHADDADDADDADFLALLNYL